MVLRNTPVQQNRLHFFKKKIKAQCTHLGLTKLNLLMKGFYCRSFSIEDKKESNYQKKPSFGAPRRVLTILLTLGLRKKLTYIFLDFLVLIIFWPLTATYRNEAY